MDKKIHTSFYIFVTDFSIQHREKFTPCFKKYDLKMYEHKKCN